MHRFDVPKCSDVGKSHVFSVIHLYCFHVIDEMLNCK